MILSMTHHNDNDSKKYADRSSDITCPQKFVLYSVVITVASLKVSRSQLNVKIPA